MAVTRWDGVSELGVALLLPTHRERTAGYHAFASTLALRGIGVALPDEPPSASRDGLTVVEGLISALRGDGAASFVVLIGHGLGGLVAAAYLESDRPQPDLAVLISPELAGRDERPPSARLRSILGRRARQEEVTAAGVMEHLDRIRVPFRLDHGGGGDMRRDAGWIDRLMAHPMTQPAWFHITPLLGSDLPNEPGLTDRVGIIGRWVHGRAHELLPDRVPPLPDGSAWERLSRAEARAAFNAYVGSEEQRLARFARAVAARGGPELGASRQDMASLGAWLLDVVEVGRQDADTLPDWARVPYGTVRRLSTESLWLIDGAASHFAAALRSHDPGLAWQLCTQRIDAFYHRPVLEPIHLAPPIPVIGVLDKLAADEPDRDWLAGSWDAWTEALRQAHEEPTGVDDPLPLDEVTVERYDHPRWNAQIRIPEEAGAVLGPTRFAGLDGRISRLKGVEDLAWEDREVMLVRLAADVDRDELRTRVVQVLQRARLAADQA